MLSLLDILFPDATMNLVKKLSPMKTIQPSINLWDTPEKYNGGMIGQLGTLPYGLTMMNVFTTSPKIVRIIWTSYMRCNL